MWVCFNNGFVSAVENRDDKTMLIARARKRQHLIDIFPDKEKEIFSKENSDYEFRLNISKDEYAEVVAAAIRNIDYDNFKNSVTDKGLHDLYGRFWRLHFDYQETLLGR